MEAEKTRRLAKVPSIAPIDPFDIASQRGCEVRFLSLPSLEGMYSPEPKPIVVIGSERPAGRRRFTCAHELGHHIFKHGMQVEDLNAQKHKGSRCPNEFLVDTFAGFLLMSQLAVVRAFNDRQISIASIQPEQIYKLANFFGVGYATLLNHLTYSLQLLPEEQAQKLLKIRMAKLVKERYGASANNEVVIVDFNWLFRSVDLDVGDMLVLPQEAEVEEKMQLQFLREIDEQNVYIAVAPGLTRSACLDRNWAVNVRVARKNYEGLARFRYLEEVEADDD